MSNAQPLVEFQRTIGNQALQRLLGADSEKIQAAGRIPDGPSSRVDGGLESDPTEVQDCGSDCQSYCPRVALHFLNEEFPQFDPSITDSSCEFGPGNIWVCPVKAQLVCRKGGHVSDYDLKVIWNGDGHRLRVHTRAFDGVTVYDYECGDGLRLRRVGKSGSHIIPDPWCHGDRW